MVRRWSHINSLNSNLFTNNASYIKPLLNSLRLVSFKSTTYYWENLYFDSLSLVTRRSYYRRRHINSFILYQNILGSWSRDYSFFRKYSRSLLSLGLFKYNYIIQNIFIAKNQDISNLVGFDTFKLTFLTNKVYLYSNKIFSSLIPTLLTYKGSYLYVSSPYKILKQNIQSTALKEEPLKLLIEKGITKSSVSLKWFSSINYLLDSILSLYLSYTVSYYKSIISAITSNIA